MMKQPCQGFSSEVQAQLAVDDQLDRHRAAHALLGRRGDRLVVGVGVQRVAVVEQRVQRLQRGADVVELDFLRVQERPEVWMWYFSIWLRGPAP